MWDDKVVTLVNDTLDIKELKPNFIDPIKNLVINDVTDMLKNIINSVLNEDGIASCNTITTMFRPLVDFVCCDLANDVIALSAASYINIY